MRPSLVIRCLLAYLLETSPSYFPIPFCASQKTLSNRPKLFKLIIYSCYVFKNVYFLAVNLCVRHGREIVEKAPWFARPLRTSNALMIIIYVYPIVYIPSREDTHVLWVRERIKK